MLSVIYLDCKWINLKMGDIFLLPGVAINRAIHYSSKWINNTKINFPGPFKRFALPVFGLSLIPLIVQPIDHGVDWAMDNTIRKSEIKPD